MLCLFYPVSSRQCAGNWSSTWYFSRRSSQFFRFQFPRKDLRDGLADGARQLTRVCSVRLHYLLILILAWKTPSAAILRSRVLHNLIAPITWMYSPMFFRPPPGRRCYKLLHLVHCDRHINSYKIGGKKRKLKKKVSSSFLSKHEPVVSLPLAQLSWITSSSTDTLPRRS